GADSTGFSRAHRLAGEIEVLVWIEDGDTTMAKLILSLEGSVIREVPLDKERVTIGRKPQNDVQIENLAVSGEHACIVTILNDSFLEDLGSTNGTLVNGNPIKKHILQNNDVIEIGKYKLKYIGEQPAAGQTPMEDFEKTMVMRAPKARAARVRRHAGRVLRAREHAAGRLRGGGPAQALTFARAGDLGGPAQRICAPAAARAGHGARRDPD